MSEGLTTNIAQFNATFRRYVAAWSGRGEDRTLDDALEKKGRDLGIKLFEGFRARKWGGAGKAPPRLARAELDARAASGVGIKLRSSLMQEYLTARAELRASISGFIGPKKDAQKLRDIKARVSLWQKYVGKELGLRQSGIGVLAASFLWFRKRSNSTAGTFYVKNRTGKPIGAVERGEGSFRIIGDAAGLSKVDARYGIVAGALATASADMEKYLISRERELFQKVFSSAA